MPTTMVCLWLAAATADISRDAAIGADSVIYLDGTDWTVEYLPPPPLARPSPTTGGGDGVLEEHTLGNEHGAVKIDATVPGDLITDLERAGLVGDPWKDTNFRDQASVWDRPGRWRYRHQLPPPCRPTGLELGCVDAAQTQVLVLDGVKMGARVELDGGLLGVVTDQFLRYNNFDINNFDILDHFAPFLTSATTTVMAHLMYCAARYCTLIGTHWAVL